MNDEEWKKDPKKSGAMGGLQRAKNMTARARTESARHAATERHKRNKKNRKVIPSLTPVM